MAWLLFRKPKKSLENNEPTSIEVFPDFPRDMPYEASLGETLKFHVRGYSDKYKMTEVELNEKDIEWQRQNYVGFFNNVEDKKADKIRGTKKILYNLPDGIENRGKLVYITARYHGLSDTTWIKISEV